MSSVAVVDTQETVVVDTRETFVVSVDTQEAFVVSVGQQGPAGRDGRDGTDGDSHYPHNQAVPDTVWVIDHNLGKYPSVICFDSANDEIEGMISYPTLNRVTVTFSAATGGYAYLN